MSDPITRQQLEDAAVDATTLSHFANDDATPGTYVTRLGRVGKVLAWLEAAVLALLNSLTSIGQISVTVGSQASATANWTALQAGLDGKGTVRIGGFGTAYIDQPLVIGSDTELKVSPFLTIKRIDGAAFNIIQTAGFGRAFTTVTVTKTSSLTASIDWTAHGFKAGQYVWLRGQPGTSDRYYFGVFPITSVTTDAFVVQLERAPAANPSGTYEAKLCDENIYIKRPNLDNNDTGRTSGSGTDLHAIIFAAVAGGECDAIVSDSAKYGICAAAVRDVDLGIKAVTNNDGIKLYGPASNVEVTRVVGFFGDDAFSIQPQEAAAFVTYDFAKGGNCIGIRVRKGNALTPDANPGGTLHTYAHPDFDLDLIEIDMCNSPSITTGSPVVIDCTEISGATGTITVKNVSGADLTTYPTGLISVLGPHIVERLTVQSVSLPNNPSSGGAQAGIFVDGASRVKILVSDGMTGFVPESGNAVRIRGTVDAFICRGFTCSPVSGATAANMINFVDSSGIGSVRIEDSTPGAFDNVLLVQAATGDARITMDNVRSDAACGVNLAIAARVTTRANKLDSATVNGMVRSTVGAVTIFEDGSSSYPSNKLSTVSGTGTVIEKVFASLKNSTFDSFAFTSGALTSAGDLGLGTNNPSSFTNSPRLAIVKDQNSPTQAVIRNNDSGSSACAEMAFNANGNSWFFGMGSGAKNSNGFYIGLDVTSPSNKLIIDTSGNVTLPLGQFAISTAKTPASASATGVTGTICWDSSYIYVCVATNTWKRTAIATW